MKNLKIAVLLLLASQPAWGYHNFFFRSADDITSGTLDPHRVDPSSFTMQGNAFQLDQVPGLNSSTQTLLTMISTTGVQVDNISLSTTQIVTSIPPRFYEVVVGTAGMPNVDFTIVRSSDLWAPLTKLNANGLTLSTTGYGKMVFVGGPFDFARATKPAGVVWEMVGVSSGLVPSVDGTTGTILTVYGDGYTPGLINFRIDGSSQSGYSGEKIVLATGAVVNGLRVVNFPNVSRAAVQSNLIYVRGSTDASRGNVVVNDLQMDNFSGRNEVTNNGDGASIYIFNSSGVYFNRPHLGRWTKQSAVANASVWGFAQSANWHIRDGIFENAYNEFMVLNGGNARWNIAGNVFHGNGPASGTGGIISGYGQQFGGTSTGTIVGNTFILERNAGSPVIRLVQSAFPTNGTVIANNIIYNVSGGALTGIVVNAAQEDTFLLYNVCIGVTCYTDAGTRTRIVQ